MFWIELLNLLPEKRIFISPLLSHASFFHGLKTVNGVYNPGVESDYNYWMMDDLHLNVFVADIVQIGTSWQYENFKCRYWRFYNNDRDGASLDFPTHSYPLQKHRLYLIPPGLTFRTRSTQEINHFFMHFDVIGLPDLALRTLFNHPLCLPPTPALEALIQQTSRELAPAGGVPEMWTNPGLHAKRNAPVAVQWQLKAILYAGLALYLKSVPQEKVEQCWQFTEDITPLSTVLRYIEERLAERLLNSDLARMCGVSEDHFIRLFRQKLGQTPARYVSERRVTLAAQRLLFTRQKLEQIAVDLGFYDRTHLSRAFKASQGISPAAYRKQPQG